MRLTRTRVGLAAGVAVATALAGSPGPATGADAPIAVARDLGTGEGTSSWPVALAGRVVVGYTEGAAGGGVRLFQYDLDDTAASMTRLDDEAFQTNISTLTDADGPYVVGGHQVGTASRSAYVLDLRTGSVTSLARFGGLLGSASAVDGGIVVGSAQDSASHLRAFAYDANGAREVIDLGTLGGPQSGATDVSGAAVVGQADLPGGTAHAFVVDLVAPGRAMTDLGTLGGTGSAATGVDGDLVVGWAEVADGSRHAFAVRRSGTPTALVDLGTLGGTTSVATAVDGEVVVGTSTRADGSEGLWYADLRTSPPVLRDLGTRAAGQPGPQVADGRVIGTRQTAAGDRGFVLDVSTGSLVELPPVPGHQRSAAVDVSADVVVGTSYGTDTSRSVAWTLGTVAAPSFRLARRRTTTSEGRRARIVVVRDGDARDAVAVRYRVRGVRNGATTGKDFRGGRGVVHFGAGQTRAVIRVRIRDDRLREGPEKARVRITAATPGTAATVPRKAWLVIRPSDR